jgi:hypothetical protein
MVLMGAPGMGTVAGPANQWIETKMKMSETIALCHKTRLSPISVTLAALFLLAACSSIKQDTQLSAARTAAPSAPVFQLDEILGAAPTTLDDRLGAPALTRREGDGEFRRYSLSTCTLIVILYPDDVGAVRAAHVDTAALTSDEEKPNLEACLAAG